MTILPKLHAIYSSAGLHPLTGHSTAHMFEWMDAPFTRFFSPGGAGGESGQIVGCAGLSLFEIMFMEHLRDYLAPKNILVIGNAHGWSTVAAALTWLEAKILAVDPDQVGIDLTNKLAQDNGLNITAVVGFSPQDLTPLWREHMGEGKADFVLIDALHTNEAVKVDFEGARALADPDAVYLFHDVVNWNLIDGIKHNQAVSGLGGRLLTRTPSGMAILFNNPGPDFLAYVDCFSDNTQLLQTYRNMVRQSFAKDPFGDAIAKL